MEWLSVVIAGLAGFGVGAIWYTVLAKPWMAASGVAIDPKTGGPANASNPVPYITSVIGSIVVAGMMRHAFGASGVDSLVETTVSGFGVGLFFVTPWIATFYAFSGRPLRLTLIDGGYATVGCTAIGLVLGLF